MAHLRNKGDTKHLSISKLSRLTKKDLREMECLKFVVTKRHETLAVLIPYSQYCSGAGISDGRLDDGVP